MKYAIWPAFFSLFGAPFCVAGDAATVPAAQDAMYFPSAPATISRQPDGRIRLDYWDDRPEAVDVLLKAKRRHVVAD